MIQGDVGGHWDASMCLQDGDRWCMGGVDEVDELQRVNSNTEVGRDSQSVCGGDHGRQPQEQGNWRKRGDNQAQGILD